MCIKSSLGILRGSPKMFGSGEGGGQNFSLFNCVTGYKFDRTKTDCI